MIIHSSNTGAISTGYGYLQAENNGVKTSNAAAANTTAWNNLMTAAANSGKAIHIGEGEFLMNAGLWNPIVPVIGCGWQDGGTSLRSDSAVPLLSFDTGVLSPQPAAGIKGLRLNGNGVGTIGLNLKTLAYAAFEELYIDNFSQTGANLTGVLLTQWRRVFFNRMLTGIKARRSTTAFETNHNIFNELVFNLCTTYAVDYADGSGVKFNDCDFEHNGTTGDANTGALKFANMALDTVNPEAIALTFDGCWAEQNGGVVLRLEEPGHHTRTVIQNTMFRSSLSNGSRTATLGVKVTGVNKDNRLVLVNSALQDLGTTSDLWLDGARASCVNIESIVQRYSVTNGGDYLKINPVSVNGAGAVAPPDLGAPPPPPPSPNLFLAPEAFEVNADTNSRNGWVKGNTTVTANATMAPNGTMTADRIVQTAATGVHNISQQVAGTGKYTISKNLKYDNIRYLVLDITDNVTGDAAVRFDLVDGTYTLNHFGAGALGQVVLNAAAITPVADGFFRCSVTATTNQGILGGVMYMLTDALGHSFAGDTSKGVFAWGAKLEAGDLTPYEPVAAS